VSERIAIWLAWKLPRSLVYWCYVRMAIWGYGENPTEQSVIEPMKRWAADR
jgi:hypothetical protein